MLSILVIVCVLLTLVVLMQRPKNEGLGAAFGSSMTENIFGAQTATVLTKATVYLGCIFFGVTLILTVLTARQSMDRRVGVLENEVRKAAVTATPKTIASPAASGSPQATPSIAASATPVSTSSPGPSTTASASVSPSPSVATESSPAPSPSAVTESSPAPSPSAATESSPAPSPSAATGTSPGPSPSVGQASPAPSASP